MDCKPFCPQNNLNKYSRSGGNLVSELDYRNLKWIPDNQKAISGMTMKGKSQNDYICHSREGGKRRETKRLIILVAIDITVIPAQAGIQSRLNLVS